MNNYKQIASHYSECFEKHGATPQGLDWSNQEDMEKRYSVMREFLKPYDVERFSPFDFKQPTILDFGCGYGGFWNHLNKRGLDSSKYTGIDINENLINKARELYPEIYFKLRDIHSEIDENNIGIFDYIICNGVFTLKHNLTQEEMTNFMCSTIEKLWEKTSRGLAFNVMSLNVDWQRDDLFHVSMDQLGRWITDNLSKNFTFRHDYSLYEYTTYIYKD